MAQPHEPEDRLAELEDRIRANPDSRLFLQLAEEYRRAERYDDALGTLRRGLERQPGTVSAQVLLGRVLLESGEVEDAVGELRLVTDRDPTHPLAHKLLSQALLADGQRVAAGETLERYALLHSGDPEIPELREAIRGDDGTEPESEPRPEPRPEPGTPAAESDLFDLGGPPAPASSGSTETDLFELTPPTAPTVTPEDDLLGVWEPATTEATTAEVAEETRDEPLPVREATAAETNENTEPGDVFGDLITARDRTRWEEGLSGGDVFAPRHAGDPPSGPVAFSPPAQPVEPELARPEPFPFEEEPVHEESVDEPAAAAPVFELEPAEEPVAAEPFQPEPAPAEPAQSAEPAQPAGSNARPPTLTLGRLYLEQGHEDEARGIFKAILERDPDHAGARQALEDLDRSPVLEETTVAAEAEVTAETEVAVEIAEPGPIADHPTPVTSDLPVLAASDLEDPADRHLGLTDRKVRLLGRYLERIRKGAERHVP